MEKNTKGQLWLVIALLAGAVVLFGAAIAVAFSGRSNNNDKPQNSIVDSIDEDEWTNNY